MAKGEKDEGGGETAAKGSPLKLILMIAPTLLLVLAVVYFLFLKPSAPASAAAAPTAGAAVPSATSTYKKGAVLLIEPITINLANGHFLKLGMALQETADAGEEVNGAHALDRAIALYSGKTVDELSTKEGREKTKEKLLEQVMEDYEKKVFDIYYTTFVMQ
jgi:flagellar FliL protein